MDKGTLISIIAVIVAAVNQVFVLLGKSPMPIDSGLIEQFLSAVFTVITALIAWIRNKRSNSEIEKAHRRNQAKKKKKSK
ncbi:phage holin [Oceanobacillus sp. 1P07AA]|uniref:phage holin n=1 Tax=Oceanobacillus sp. 1P07AA TaxID=3132293 RepID=UPI0039A62B28